MEGFNDVWDHNNDDQDHLNGDDELQDDAVVED